MTMSGKEDDATKSVALRNRAQQRLNRDRSPDGGQQSARAALGVLHQLASSPTTAADALALLHELQVHQVELTLQYEELGGALAAAELALARQTQLYEFAPAAQYCIDRNTTVLELNAAGAGLLEGEREALLGQPLAHRFAPEGPNELQAALTQIAADRIPQTLLLQLQSVDGHSREALVSIGADPAQAHAFLVVALLTTDSGVR